MALPIPMVGFCLFVLPQGATCEILVPQSGIELPPPVLEGRVLTTGPPKKSLPMIFNSILQLVLVCEPPQLQHVQSKTISASKFSSVICHFFCSVNKRPQDLFLSLLFIPWMESVLLPCRFSLPDGPKIGFILLTPSAITFALAWITSPDF